MQTPVIGKCEDNRSVENASPHFLLAPTSHFPITGVCIF